jgi:hypothetical protein
MTPQIDDAYINKNEIVDRAMDAITDGFASYGYLTKSSFDERVWTAIYDQLQHAEITPLK